MDPWDVDDDNDDRDDNDEGDEDEDSDDSDESDEDEDSILYRKSNLGETTRINYERLPWVTLSALNETGRAESTIPVLQQRSYTGKLPVITSALANARCIDLGMDRILEILNMTLGTSYTLDDHDSILQSVFQSFIARNYDFGIVYANVRPYWYDLTFIKHIGELWMKDQERRQECLTDNGISRLGFLCRRVWDLCANRVVPYWVTHCSLPMPISHAWMAPEDRVDLWTPINCSEWPVPIPKDADLNLIRIEMLNQQGLVPFHSVEYVWLDVLCLRQEGGEREDLRAEEWKVDVPTIGFLFRPPVQFVVYYLSGLGRPLRLKPGDLENERNWFNRAWTLQETAEAPIIGGSTDVDLITDNDVKANLKEKLQSVERIKGEDVFYFLWQMQIRKSTKPLDKVAGLAYLLCGDSWMDSKYIPVYDETQSQEDAWDMLVDAMNVCFQLELLFIYPEPGNGPQRWRPSWKQVMERRILCPERGQMYRPQSHIRKLETGDFLYEGPCIKSGFVSGLAHGSYEEGKPRQGKLVIQLEDGPRAPHIIKVFAHHAFPIPDGLYTLIGTKYSWVRKELPTFTYLLQYWVVGWRRWDQRFEKLSVINTYRILEQDYKNFDDIEPFTQLP